MPRQHRVLALLSALAVALGLAVVLPTASASTVGCAAAWSSTAVYVNGNTSSYNSHNWQAKWWTQGDTPGGSAGVWADQGACGDGSGGSPTTAPAGSGCSYPA